VLPGPGGGIRRESSSRANDPAKSARRDSDGMAGIRAPGCAEDDCGYSAGAAMGGCWKIIMIEK